MLYLPDCCDILVTLLICKIFRFPVDFYKKTFPYKKRDISALFYGYISSSYLSYFYSLLSQTYFSKFPMHQIFHYSNSVFRLHNSFQYICLRLLASKAFSISTALNFTASALYFVYNIYISTPSECVWCLCLLKPLLFYTIPLSIFCNPALYFPPIFNHTIYRAPLLFHNKIC